MGGFQGRIQGGGGGDILQLKIQVRIQDFKLGGGALKKIAPSRGRRENCWGISYEKSSTIHTIELYNRIYNTHYWAV
jgi:hypothetical protein